MDKILHDVLRNINQGIVMLDENSNVIVWNRYMQNITGIHSENTLNHNIFTVLPSLDKHYFKSAIESTIANGSNLFFSAAMHHGLINEKEHYNLKVSRIDHDESKYILLEFMNVTNEYMRIHQLRNNINQLCLMNKGLEDKHKKIRNLAYYDELTAVANRTLFYELAEKLMFDAKQNNYLLGLMFIDVDKFKNINDTYGHEIGDKVLARVAEVLKKSTRRDDVVARYGGDEFLVLLPHMQSFDNYSVIASKIINESNRFIRFGKQEIELSLTIGVSFYPQNGKSIHQLISAADKAMYTAKRERKSCHNAAYDAGINKKNSPKMKS